MTRTEPRRRGSRRGIFLVQTMVLVLILAIVATGMLWVSFGRHILISRANAAESDQQLAAGVQSQVQACLDGTTYGSVNCAIPAAAAACFPASIGGKTVKVSSPSSKSPPNCQLSVTVVDQ
jgi:hypothetical protein